MKNVCLFLMLIFGTAALAQDIMPHPKSHATGVQADWTQPLTKMAVDTCGAYFNNYVGLVKTTDIYFEEMRTGDGSDFEPYTGRGQRFHANQPIEVSGLQFYSFQNNDSVDSLMVITLLLDYDEVNDSVGLELARDTVWVSHTEFTPLLTELEVNSYFDTPVVVEEDYIVAVYTSTNDSLKIITNDPGGDGAGEGLAFAYYENPVAPSFTGWYSFTDFGPGYDLDYLINPLVRYKLHDDFSLDNDTVCPNIVSAACTDYVQVANFSDPHYNRFYDTPAVKVVWNWGDGYQNIGLTELCHTYEEPGTYTITLIDSIRRHDFDDFTCAVELTKTIVVLDSTVITMATGTSSGLTGTFSGAGTLVDSVFWDFGDGSEGSTELDPSHSYTDLDTYEVWFYAYGPCNTDSAMVTVTLDDVGLSENNTQLSIYPNPSREFVIINGLPIGTSIEIVNILGETLFNGQNSTETLTIKTADFAQGTYFIRMTGELGQTTRKIVVRH